MTSQSSSPNGLKAPVRAKWIAPSWIEEQLQGVAFKSLYDPFAGQGQVARYFKRSGKRVVASDLLMTRKLST